MSENDNLTPDDQNVILEGAPGGGMHTEEASPFSRPSSLTEDQEAEIFKRLNEAQERMARINSTEEPSDEEEESQEEYEELPQDEEGQHSRSEMEVFAKLGYASKTFEVTEGNRVQLRTLTEDQILDAQVKAASHPPAIQVRMSQIYCLAQSIQRFNGKPWYRRRPTGDDDDLLEEKANILKSRYRPVLNRLLQEYNDLELDTAKKIDFIKKG